MRKGEKDPDNEFAVIGVFIFYAITIACPFYFFEAFYVSFVNIENHEYYFHAFLNKKND